MLPECLDDYVAEENPVRVVDVFIDELDLRALEFEGVDPATTGRPAPDFKPSLTFARTTAKPFAASGASS